MKNTTACIFTHNRPGYLKRIISYYDKYGGDFNIVVVDSSSDENKLINKEIISSFLDLSITHLPDYEPEINVFHKILDALDYIKGEYVVLCADDDFIAPSGIKKAVNFLEKNADFTVAYGRSIVFWPRSISYNRQELVCNIEPLLLSVTSAEPDKRLEHYMSNYAPTFYGVHKKDFIKRIFAEGSAFTEDSCFAELLMSALTSIHGKIKYMDVFYAARESMPTSRGSKVKKMSDFIKDGSYDEKYAKFRDCLSRHLCEKSGSLNVEKSQRVIDYAMSAYLSIYINRKQSIKKATAYKIKNILANSKLPQWMYEWIRSAYRRLFHSGQLRMGNIKDFANTPYSGDCEEINNIYRHLLLHSEKDKVRQCVG